MLLSADDRDVLYQVGCYYFREKHTFYHTYFSKHLMDIVLKISFLSQNVSCEEYYINHWILLN